MQLIQFKVVIDWQPNYFKYTMFIPLSLVTEKNNSMGPGNYGETN